MVDRYLPDHVTQRGTDPCQWEHCWAAVGAWLTDGASGGKRTPDPVRFCALARKDPCENGGLSDMIRGLETAGQKYVYRADVPKDEVRRILRSRTGKLVALEIDMDSWPASNGDAYHSIGVVCGIGTGKFAGKVKTMDPAEDNYRHRDLDGVLTAALEYNAEHHERPGTIDVLIVTPPRVGG